MSHSVLFINQDYHPDLVSAGQRLTDLAEYLAEDGFDVKVLCGRGGYEGESEEAPLKEIRNGVQIRRFRTPNFGRSSSLGRVTDYGAFFLQAFGHVLTSSPPDFVITLTTPPLVNLIGLGAYVLQGQRYGIWSMDLHPDGEKALGMLTEGSLPARALDALNDAAHKRADFVVALGRRMAQRIRKKGVSDDNVTVLPMWTKGMNEIPDKENPLLNDFDLGDKFVVLYAGNAGLFHQFGGICDCIRHFKNHGDIYFLFVGGGPRKEEILSFVEKEEVGNFEYRNYVPRDELKYILSIADVHLLSLRPEIAGVAVPSKLYDSMMSARPVVMVGPEGSESAMTIEQGNFGFVIDPSDQSREAVTEGLVDSIMSLYRQPELRREMGRRASQLYGRQYAREVVCEKWSRFLCQEL